MVVMQKKQCMYSEDSRFLVIRDRQWERNNMYGTGQISVIVTWLDGSYHLLKQIEEHIQGQGGSEFNFQHR